MITSPDDIDIQHQQMSAPKIKGDVQANLEAILSAPTGPRGVGGQARRRGSDRPHEGR